MRNLNLIAKTHESQLPKQVAARQKIAPNLYSNVYQSQENPILKKRDIHSENVSSGDLNGTNQYSINLRSSNTFAEMSEDLEVDEQPISQLNDSVVFSQKVASDF